MASDPTPDPAAAPLARGPGLVLLLALLPFVGTSRYNGDEFTYMSLGLRVAQGEVPYRDFFEFVGPTSLVLLGATYRVLGASLLTTHLLMVALAWLMAWLAARVARRLGAGPRSAWLAGAVALFGAFTHWPVYSHHWVAAVPALAAVEAALAGLGTAALAPWLLAGAATGVAGLAVQSEGAALGIALAAGLALDGVARRGLRVVAPQLLALAAGTAAVLGLTGGVLAALGALHAAWADAVVWPLTRYKLAGGLNDQAFGADLPALLAPNPAGAAWLARATHVAMAYVLVVGALGGFAAWVVARLARLGPARSWSAADARTALAGAWLALAFLAFARGRADYAHLSFVLVPAGVVATGWAARLAAARASRGRLVPLALLGAYAATGALMVANAVRKEPEIWNRPLDPDARLVAFPVMRHLRAQARPGDRLAALPYGGYFYFYGPPPAVRHALMVEPGQRYSTAAEWEAYWAEVVRERPRFLVIGEVPGLPVAPYLARVPAGYRRVGAFGSPQFGPAFPAQVFEWAGPPTGASAPPRPNAI